MARAKDELHHSQAVQRPRTIDLRDDVISIDEVSRRLDVPKSTLYDWRYRGIGPRGHKVGRHLKYRWSDVLRWLEEQD